MDPSDEIGALCRVTWRTCRGGSLGALLSVLLCAGCQAGAGVERQAPEPMGDASVDAGSASFMDAAAEADAASSDGGTGPETPPWESPAATAFLKRVSRVHLASFEQGTRPVAWSEAATLEALMHMWEATDDPRILDEVAVHLDVLVRSRSSARGTVEALTGKPVPTWPTDGYDCGHYRASAALTGILTYPMAWFARRVLERPDLDQHRDRALTYLRVVEDALVFHRPQYTNNGDTGRYRHPSNYGDLEQCEEEPSFQEKAGRPLPFNMMAAMGRAHLQHARALEANGESGAQHLEYADRLARYFLSHVEAHEDMRVWLYVVDGRYEDIRHASLVIRFVALMTEEGRVFRTPELDGFVETFLFLTEDFRNVRPSLKPDRVGESTVREQQAALRWVPLSIHDRRVYDRAHWIYHDADGDTLLGSALLQRYKPDAYTYPIRARSWQGLPVHQPEGAEQPSWATGLYRPSDTQTGTLNGKTISSCARWIFAQTMRSQTLQLRYRQTARTMAGDSCGTCDDVGGLLLFTRSAGADWRQVSVPAPTNVYTTREVDVTAVKEVMACRGGAGHGRKNIDVQLVRFRDWRPIQ